MSNLLYNYMNCSLSQINDRIHVNCALERSTVDSTASPDNGVNVHQDKILKSILTNGIVFPINFIICALDEKYKAGVPHAIDECEPAPLFQSHLKLNMVYPNTF